MNQAVCPTRDELADFDLGRLSPQRHAEIDRHLQECDSCSAVLAALDEGADSLVDGLRRLANEEISDDSGVTRPYDRLAEPDETFATATESTGPRQGTSRQLAQLISEILAPPQADDELGRLGDYRILEVLGAGGMGVVFRAEDPELQRPVALKAMKAAGALIDDEARERFLREARATAAVRHDSILTIHQVGEDRGIPFLATELLEGESLAQRLAREGRLSVDEASAVACQIAQGLAAAHRKELLHRDIKPANIWLEAETGRVKILDFGLARALNDDSDLTHSGAIVGTPNYLSPEQATGEDVDERTDLFSLGVVFYQMLTGERPFDRQNLMAILHAIGCENPPPPHAIHEDIPLGISRLVMQLLAKEPSKRFDSADEVVQALQGAGIPTLTDSMSRARHSLKWLLAGLCLAIVAVIVTATFVGRLNNGKSTLDPSIAEEPSDTANRPNFGLEFDGQDDYLSIPVEYGEGRSMTLELRVKASAELDEAERSTQLLSLGPIGIEFSPGLGQFMVRARCADGNQVVLESPTGLDGRFHDLAIVRDNTELRFYVDGQLAAQAALSDDLQSSAGQHHLACVMVRQNPLMCFRGIVDAIHISRGTRYTVDYQPVGYEVDEQTLALYSFDEGQGTKALDASSTSLVTTIHGGKWVRLAEPSAQITATSLSNGEEYQSALEFQQWGDKVRIEGLDELDAPLCIEAWVTPWSHRKGHLAFFGAPHWVTLEIHSGRWQMAVVCDGKSYGCSSDDFVEIGKRVHLRGTWDGARVSLYVDGRHPKPQKGGKDAWTWNGVPGSYLGRATANKQYFFEGLIHQFHCTKSIPDQGDFVAPERFTADENTLVLYHCNENENSDHILFDSSGHGHHGTITGARWTRWPPPPPPVTAVAPFDREAAWLHQRAWAEYLGVPVEETVDLPPGDEKIEMILIPPGEFTMGTEQDEVAPFMATAKAEKDQVALTRIPAESPSRRVRITMPFYLGKYEVTRAQWQSVMENDSSLNSDTADHPNYPVGNVTWVEADRFVKKLNERTSPNSPRWTLPTEAQWEIACRAGTTTPWYFGNDQTRLRYHGWFRSNSDWKRHPVGRLRPDPFGLYDMYGNESEWCANWFDWGAEDYSKDSLVDPQGLPTGAEKAYRGGCWAQHGHRCRSAAREGRLPEAYPEHPFPGLRLALTIPVPKTSKDLQATRVAPETVAFKTFLRLDEASRQTLKDGQAPIDVPHAPLEKQMTAEVWLRWNGERLSAGQDMEVMRLGRIAVSFHGNEDPYVLQLSVQPPGAEQTNGPDYTVPPGLTAIPRNEFVHVAVVRDNCSFRAYLNGRRQCQADASESFFSAPDEGRITLATDLRGDIAAFRYSTSVRYEDDFVPPTNFEPNAATQLLYRFDERRETSLLDGSGHDRDGKINAGTWIVDLLATIDLSRDPRSGEWDLADGHLVSSISGTSHLQIQSEPPDEYQLAVVLRRRTGYGSFNICLPVQDRMVTAVIDAYGRAGVRPPTSGLSLLNGKKAFQSENPTSRPGLVMTGDNWHRLTYTVRKNSLTVDCNGKPIIEWKGDPSELSGEPQFLPSTFQPGRLVISTWESSSVEISRLELRPLVDSTTRN